MKRNWILILFVLSAVVLASCSSPSSSSATDSVPTEPVAAGETPVATDEIPADEAPPSDAPVGDTALLIDTSSVCYNPFFPVSEDASWTFQYDTGETYKLTIDITGEDTFTITQTLNNDDLVASMDYFCTEEGILQGEFAQIDLLDELGEDGLEIDFKTAEWTGHTLPNPDEVDVGSTWTSTYTLSGDMNVGALETTADATVTINYVVGAIEEVTVPAGTFPQAYRVDSTSDMEITLSMGESVVPFSGFNYSSSTWYVEDLGMIKSSDTFEGGSSAVELVDSSLID